MYVSRRYLREKWESLRGINTELADVLIMCYQLLMIYDNTEQVRKQIDYKIRRLAERLK